MMNINPADRLNAMTDPVIHTYTRCLYTENGHGVSNTRTFTIMLQCNSNYAVTLPTEMQAQQNFEIYLDSDLTADYSFDFTAYTDYTHPGVSKCQLSTYDVYQTDASTAGYTGFTKSADTNKVVAIAHSRVDSSALSALPTYQFKIRGYFIGGTTAFSEIIQYEVVCGKEILAITQNTIPGTDDFIYTYDQSGVTDAAGGDSTPSATILKNIYAAYMTDNSSALCPIDSWALFETIDESNEASMSTDSRITIDGYAAGKTYTITYLKYDPAASTTGEKNYYEHIYLRGYTKARYNTLRPVTIKTTMKLVFDICGWENVTEPIVPDAG